MCRVSWNLGASNSWIPQGLSRPVMGLLCLYLSCTFYIRFDNGCTRKAETCSTFHPWLAAWCFISVKWKRQQKFYLAVKFYASLCVSTTPWMSVWRTEAKLLDLRLCGKWTLPHYWGTEQTVAICGMCSGLDVFANSPLVCYQICFTNSNSATFRRFYYIIIIWHYNPMWVFDFSAKSLQDRLSLAVSFQFYVFSFFRSSMTFSCHRCLGLPTGLFPIGFQSNSFLVGLASSILWTYPSHLNLCKVKCTLVQARRLCTGRTVHGGSRGIALLRLCTGRTAHRGSRGIALLFHDQRH
jgi:hypothetical protein